MKILMAILIGLMMFVAPVEAQETQDVAIQLAWDANTESDLAGYRLYDSSDTAIPIAEIPAGTETYTVEMNATENAPRCFYLTAFDTSSNESAPSDTVCQNFNFAPGSPANIRLSITIVVNID